MEITCSLHVVLVLIWIIYLFIYWKRCQQKQVEHNHLFLKHFKGKLYSYKEDFLFDNFTANLYSFPIAITIEITKMTHAMKFGSLHLKFNFEL